MRGRAIDDASWSRDGRFVHFGGLTDAGRALFRVQAPDGVPEKLAMQPATYYAWSGVDADGAPSVLQSVKLEDIYALEWRPY